MPAAHQPRWKSLYLVGTISYLEARAEGGSCLRCAGGVVTGSYLLACYKSPNASSAGVQFLFPIHFLYIGSPTSCLPPIPSQRERYSTEINTPPDIHSISFLKRDKVVRLSINPSSSGWVALG
ncbi:hypothetical protein BJY04DRAFT_42738 [Aspergillus karnatakaensis]|uniref:uncharacterized protein n=1 Tax=Aspergillus karnatakaensis TaxID=1810916 RepID=UPI003CCCFBFE